jgi:hypothetical protein
MISNASDAEIEQMRKTRPHGMPVEMFDLIVATMRMQRDGRERPPKRSKFNPSQPDLFDL